MPIMANEAMASKVIEHLKKDEGGCLDRLFDWLRIPSISTDPAYRDQTRRAGEWAADHLRKSGFKVEIAETGTKQKPGHPVVLATCDGAPTYRGPHILYYGHYDVQPPDPLDLWESPAFEPVIRRGAPGDRIVARGSCDDKGQVSTILEAMRAWKEASGLTAGGVRCTILLEGEEESGSVNLARFLEQRESQLRACDACVISDTGMLGRGKPAITYGVRGLLYTEVTLHGPSHDLHSGLWGGRVINPNSELVRILSGLWDDKRRVTIPGFYDSVREVGPDERAQWKSLGISVEQTLREIGLPPQADVGEAGFTAVEREWARPTAEINGIYGGYIGKGAKTVIPAHASAKVSFRLVADQDPASIQESFYAWLRARTPAGFRWEFHEHGAGRPATVATDSEVLRMASRAMEQAAGRAPALIKSGGSIPIAGMLKERLGMDTVFMGFGLDDDRVHSPNEKFELECYRIGLRSHAIFIAELARSVSGKA